LFAIGNSALKTKTKKLKSGYGAFQRASPILAPAGFPP
jgi:hypothetical protein